MDRLQSRVSKTRPAIQVQAGTGAKTFVAYSLTKAIYTTAWDDNIILEADNSGNWTKLEFLLVPALVNINTATAAELESLPGLGVTKAQAIVTFRNQHGNFTSIEALDNVPGIGPATINLVRPYIRF